MNEFSEKAIRRFAKRIDRDSGNALDALMFVLAIDAEKCSRN